MLKHLGQNSVGCSFQVHWLECWKSRWETFADVRLQLECSIFFRIQLVARLSKLTTYIDSWPPDSTDCRDVNIQVQKTYQGNLLQGDWLTASVTASRALPPFFNTWSLFDLYMSHVKYKHVHCEHLHLILHANANELTKGAHTNLCNVHVRVFA